MSRHSIHSTWKFIRDEKNFELVEVIIDGEVINKNRVIRQPARTTQGYYMTLSFSILEKDGRKKKGEQIGLFEEES